MKLLKTSLMSGLLILLMSTVTWALSAREIMLKVDARDDGDNIRSQMEMVLIDKKGHERKRLIQSFTKDVGADTHRLMFFLEPADVRDTAFLTYDYDGEKDDDQWLYLPALKKTKRIASSDKDGAFMGSDFFYADMTKREVDNYTHTLVKEMEVRGHNCWLIQSIPINQKIVDEYGYTKSLVFVRQDNFVVVRGVNWTKSGGRLKYMDTPKLEKIDGIWTAREITMTTKKGKKTLHKTILRFNDVKYNQNLKSDMFSVRRMEKGL